MGFELDGFWYLVNTAELKRYMGLTAEDKLRWLSRANTTLKLLPAGVQDLHRQFINSPHDNPPAGESA